MTELSLETNSRFASPELWELTFEGRVRIRSETGLNAPSYESVEILVVHLDSRDSLDPDYNTLRILFGAPNLKDVTFSFPAVADAIAFQESIVPPLCTLGALCRLDFSGLPVDVGDWAHDLPLFPSLTTLVIDWQYLELLSFLPPALRVLEIDVNDEERPSQEDVDGVARDLESAFERAGFPKV